MKSKILALSLGLVATMLMTGCNTRKQSSGSSSSSSSSSESEPEVKPNHSFALVYEGGCPAISRDTKVSVKNTTKGGESIDLTQDEDGRYYFEDALTDEYEVTVTLGKGYSYVEETQDFTFDANQAALDVKITSSVIDEERPSDHLYGYFDEETQYPVLYTGELMYNLSFTNLQSVTYTLKETLETKKMVMLNFWATWCGPCENEFPAIETAYQANKDNISIFSMSSESKSTINKYVKSHGMTFDVGVAPDGLETAFVVYYVPTTVLIDRYGRIADYVIGSIDDSDVWDEEFKYLSADDYVPEMPTEEAE